MTPKRRQRGEGPSLTEFLLARIAEDAADAQDAFYDGQRRVPEEEAVVAADRDLDPILFLDRKRDAHHAANWSPDRVLAECEAKRQIVEALEGDTAMHRELFRGCGDDCEWKALEYAAQCLALPYADHPDYRDEWRP